MGMCRQITCRILGSWLKLTSDPFLIAAKHDGEWARRVPLVPQRVQFELAQSSGCIDGCLGAN